MLVNSRDLRVVCSALYCVFHYCCGQFMWFFFLKKDGLFFWIVQSLVGFSCLWFFFTYGDYNPNTEKDSV